MKIAVEGCCHGELDKIYETLAYLEDVNSIKVDLLLICGDFQAVRNKSDLQCMAVPEKYQCMNTFYKYYSGEKKAPVLTVFIGGNHEASNYMQELPYGGWVAPNIFYMGYANVLRFGGLRIAGLSGIYNPRHFAMGHFERPPYSRDTVRSAYHVRNLEVFRLKQISRPLDIVMSHDWPRGIYNFGNKEGLIRHKSFLQKEIEQDCLGSPPAEELLHRLQPSYWFSAHLHTKFAAFVEHQSEGIGSKTTKFLSLDKCLPRRRFLQVLDFPHDEGFPLQLELDPEWLCILRTTDHLLNLHRTKTYMPGPGSSEKWDFRVTDAEIESVKEDFGNDMRIPENFTTTVPAYTADEAGRRVSDFPSPTVQVNPQTTLLCTMLDLSDPNAMFLGRESSFALDPEDSNLSTARDSDNEDVLSGDETDDANVTYESSMDGTFNSSFNPDEIQLDVDNDEDEGIGEMENESEANVSTASSGAGDVDECLAVRLSGVNPLDESSDLREADEDELQSILDAQAARKSANSPRELDDQDISTEGSVKQKGLAGAVSPPFRLSVSENITTSSPRPLGESPRPLDESPRPLGESETDKSSQDEDDELGEILAAQAKLKSSPLQNDNSTGCCNVTDAVESSSSPRSSIGKQKYDVDSTVEIEEQPTSKKFKRRNLSMYSGDEEDCV